MSAQTFRPIKAALGSLQRPVEPDAVQRLVSFGESLATSGGR